MRPRSALFLPAVLFLFLSAAAPAQAQDDGPPKGPFWIYAKIEVNTTKHTPDGDKHQFRVYVSNLVSITPDVWVNLLRYHAKDNVSDYFNATVVKANETVGVEISYYDQDVDYDCTCIGSSNEVRPKSDVEKHRDEDIQTAKEGEHPVLFFNWDPTGKNKEQDLKEEIKKLGGAKTSDLLDDKQKPPTPRLTYYSPSPHSASSQLVSEYCLWRFL